jgi:hypothetical protein
MEMSGGPETKKARWSPNSFTSPSVPTNGNANGRDLFANYGYGNQAAVNQAAAFGAPGTGLNSNLGLGATGQQLYSTPSLTVNTATNGVGMAGQMSPSSATSPFPGSMQQQQQQQQQMNGAQGNAGGYAGFGGYNMNGMLGMGLPSMGMLGVGGFPYSPQIGSFQQVRDTVIPSTNRIANFN